MLGDLYACPCQDECVHCYENCLRAANPQIQPLNNYLLVNSAEEVPEEDDGYGYKCGQANRYFLRVLHEVEEQLEKHYAS